MINKMINIFHVGAHPCVRPGRHAGLPLRLILCVFFITGLTACKVDFSIFGSGTVQSASGSINCTSDGTTQTGDCTQTYNVDENNVACSGANCTVVTDTITETYTATPVQDDTFDGFADHCSGAGPCVKEITESEANVDQLVTAEVHFDPEAVPQDATYTYNYLGQRASKTVNSVTTYYIYDEQGNMLSEIDSSGNSIKDYIYMDGEYIAHVEQTGDTGSSETQEQLFYPLNDHLGQSFMVMRADEKFSHEQYTTPFGQMHAQFVDTNVGTGPLKQNRRFPGQYYDAESGYAQNWNREYDSSTGNYVESDPLIAFGNTNLANESYFYAADNPLIYTDFKGLYTYNTDDTNRTGRLSGDADRIATCLENCLGIPIVISGGSECTGDGRHVPGGVVNSRHCTNQAFDMHTNSNKTKTWCCAYKCGATGSKDEGSQWHFQTGGIESHKPSQCECQKEGVDL